MPNVVQVVEGIIDLIQKNIIAKTNISSDATTGDTIIFVENAFHFNNGEEIVLIDSGYNTSGSSHYHIFEYAKIYYIFAKNY